MFDHFFLDRPRAGRSVNYKLLLHVRTDHLFLTAPMGNECVGFGNQNSSRHRIRQSMHSRSPGARSEDHLCKIKICEKNIVSFCPACAHAHVSDVG